MNMDLQSNSKDGQRSVIKTDQSSLITARTGVVNSKSQQIYSSQKAGGAGTGYYNFESNAKLGN